MERQPTEGELEEARERARAEARRRVAAERGGTQTDEPIVEGDGPYEFAPEAARAEYERVLEQTLSELRDRGSRDRRRDHEEGHPDRPA